MPQCWCPLADFNLHKLMAAVRAKEGVEVIIAGVGQFSHDGKRPDKRGVISVPGEIACALMANGRALFTDAEAARLTAEGIVLPDLTVRLASK
jgi:hypothetical protein